MCVSNLLYFLSRHLCIFPQKSFFHKKHTNAMNLEKDFLRPSKLTVYDLSKYTFIEKLPHKPSRDISAKAKLERLKTKFDRMGTIRSLDCVLLVHCKNAINVIVLQEPSTGRYRLPGGKKHSLESDLAAMQRHLRKFFGKPDNPVSTLGDTVDWGAIPVIETMLATEAARLVQDSPETSSSTDSTSSNVTFQLSDITQTETEAERTRAQNSFHVHECLAEWTRPNFEMVLYPYSPPHITVPKETKKVFVLQMPPNFTFTVPKNYSIIAIPLYELYGNPERFGSALLSSLPASLSRFTFDMR